MVHVSVQGIAWETLDYQQWCWDISANALHDNDIVMTCLHPINAISVLLSRIAMWWWRYHINKYIFVCFCIAYKHFMCLCVIHISIHRLLNHIIWWWNLFLCHEKLIQWYWRIINRHIIYYPRIYLYIYICIYLCTYLEIISIYTTNSTLYHMKSSAS